MTVEQPLASAQPEIENLLREARTFPPDPAFTAQANATADLRSASPISSPSSRWRCW